MKCVTIRIFLKIILVWDNCEKCWGETEMFPNEKHAIHPCHSGTSHRICAREVKSPVPFLCICDFIHCYWFLSFIIIEIFTWWQIIESALDAFINFVHIYKKHYNFSKLCDYI
jgi:hypothetical protein